MRRRRVTAGTIAVTAAAGAWCLLAMAPVVVALVSSLKTNVGIVLDPISLPTSPAFANYLSALVGTPGGQPMPTYLRNSAVATGVGVVLGTALAVLAGYYLARLRGRGSRLWGRYFFLLLALPPVVTIIPLFTLTEQLGLRGSTWGLGIVYAAGSIPLSVILMRAYFADFPIPILEAAALDGASETRIFLSVVLPLARGPIATIMLLQGISMWNELALALILLTASESYTTPIGILLFTSQYASDLGATYAGLMIAAIPILLAYAVFNRQLIDGLRVGAVK